MLTDPENGPDLNAIAQQVGRDWKHAQTYYSGAETVLEDQWNTLVWPFIESCDFSVCLDLAAGHGRNTSKLVQMRDCRQVFAVDINQENVDFCAQRFSGESRVTCLRNDGFTIPSVAPQSVSLFYCFDAMVHFDSDIVRSYLREISRVIAPEIGRAFLHHSNYTGNPGGDVHDNPHWRNFMSAELLAHYAVKEGLEVVKQQTIDWNFDHSFIDCLTLLRLK